MILQNQLLQSRQLLDLEMLRLSDIHSDCTVALQDGRAGAGRQAAAAHGPGRGARHELPPLLPAAHRAPRPQVPQPAGGQRLDLQGALGTWHCSADPLFCMSSILQYQRMLPVRSVAGASRCRKGLVGGRYDYHKVRLFGSAEMRCLRWCCAAGVRFWAVPGAQEHMDVCQEPGRHARVDGA